MTDMSGAFTPSRLADGDPGLETIERSGVTVTESFVEAFNNMTDEQRTIWVEDARRNILADEFGWATIFLNDPELGPLLRRAVGPPEWSPTKLKREIEKTNWWKSRTASQRQWDQASASDPSTANNRIEERKRGIRQVASGLNGVLTDEQLTELSTESLRSGWSDETLISAIGTELVKGTGFSGGGLRFGITGQSVRRVARSFGVPLSEQAADEWAEKIATGKAFLQDFQNWASSQAKSLYPSLVADIDRGLDVSTIVDPYIQVASRTLGVSAEQINFADPKWNAALNFDDGKGRRMMTLFEWGDHLRRDERYGYDRTPNARNKAYDVVDRLGRMFGVTA